MITPEGIFVFVDDDQEEHELFTMAIREICDNKIIFASDGEQALEVINQNKHNIFLIISDINMPRINGLELKKIIEGTPELKLLAIPFIYHSAHDNPLVVKEAFSMGIQGFIKKSRNLKSAVKDLELIINFWSSSVHPNSIY